MLRKIFLFFFALLPSLVFSQDDVEMADTFRSEGKIYVVIAILTVIFLGIIIHLISIDRKVTRMEKKMGK